MHIRLEWVVAREWRASLGHGLCAMAYSLFLGHLFRRWKVA